MFMATHTMLAMHRTLREDQLAASALHRPPPHTGAREPTRPSRCRPDHGRPLMPEATMDMSMATTRLEGAIQQQVIVAGGDPEVEAAARAILSALEPAVRQLAYDLAEQAAAEVAGAAARPRRSMWCSSDGRARRCGCEPTEGEPSSASSGESLDARITLRLPPTLKELIEAAADAKGESVNSWLVPHRVLVGRRGTAAVPPRHGNDRDMRAHHFRHRRAAPPRGPASVRRASGGLRGRGRRR